VKLPISTAVLGPALLASCMTVGPDYQEPALPLPAAWSAPAAAEREDLSRWWERLEDPLLARLVADALQASPDLRSAQARLREARARRELAGAQRAPTVDAGASTRAAWNSDSDATSRLYSAGFDAGWEIDVFGGKRRALEAAEADLQSAAASLEAARVSLAAEVARNYVEARAFQVRLAIARSNLESQSETLRLTDWRAQAGLVSSLDVEQARANREQTRAQIPSLETSLAAARHRLAVLLGLPPAALRERLAGAAPIPRAPAQIASDVRVAERSLAAETARIGQAEAGRWPSFTLSGSIGLEAASLDALTGGATTTRALAAAVAAPVFDGGRLRQQVEIQRAAQERARVGYESAVLAALEEVENALAAVGNSGARRAALADALAAERNAALLARHRYTAGLIDFQTVLDTERSVLQIEDSLAVSEADGVLAVIQLYKALGGGWTPGSAQ
jgi:outer membrane protein, multidrug efflux system